MHLVFYKTNDVFLAEEKLQDRQIKVEVVPTPVQDKAYCGVCVRINNDDLDNAKKELDCINISSERIEALEKEREKLRAGLKGVESEMGFIKKKKVEGTKEKPLTLHIGDKVHVVSMNLDGTVSSLPNEKGMFFVQMGILRSQVNIGDVYLLEETEDIAKKVKSESWCFSFC